MGKPRIDLAERKHHGLSAARFFLNIKLAVERTCDICMRAMGWWFGMKNHAPSCKNGPDTDYNQSCSISWNLLILRLKHFTRNVYSCVSLPCWCLLQKQNSERFFFFNSHFIVLKVSWWCLQTCLHLYAFSLLSIFSIHHLSVKICFVFLFCVFVCLLSFKCSWGVDLRHIRPLKAHLVWQPLFKILGAWRRWSHITSIFAMIHCERRWIPQIVGSGWNQGNTARAAAPSLRQHRQKKPRPKQGLKSHKPTKALPDLKSGGENEGKNEVRCIAMVLSFKFPWISRATTWRYGLLNMDKYGGFLNQCCTAHSADLWRPSFQSGQSCKYTV